MSGILLWTVLSVCLVPVSGVDPDVGTHCPTYVAESGTVTCDCRVPQGIVPQSLTITWPGVSSTSELRVSNVRREDNGTQYTCRMELNGDITTAVYTLQVQYGPTNASTTISGPSPFPTDGSQPVTLTCQATDVNPVPRYSWTNVACSNGNQQNTCTFTPSFPGDDGKVVMCEAKNPGISVGPSTAWATFTLGSTEVTTQPTSPPPTTQPPTPSPTTVPVTTSSRVTTAPPVTTNQVTTSPVTTRAPVSTSPTVTTATPVVMTTSRTSTSAAVSTDTPSGTNTTDAVTDQTGSTVPAVQSIQSSVPVEAITGGVIGGVVLLVVIAVIAVVVWKRNRDRRYEKPQPRRDQEINPYTSLHVNMNPLQPSVHYANTEPRPDLSQAEDPAGYMNVETTNTYDTLTSTSTDVPTYTQLSAPGTMDTR